MKEIVTSDLGIAGGALGVAAYLLYSDIIKDVIDTLSLLDRTILLMSIFIILLTYMMVSGKQ